MPLTTIDFETAYSQEYSLRKMSTAQYILHPSFEVIGCAIKEGAAPSEWHVGKVAVARRFAQIDWSRSTLLAHNMRFDGAIAAWHFGIKPAMYLDTLSMARAMTHSVLGSSSLASVADYMGVGHKGTEVTRAMGKWLRDFTLEELALYGSYCKNDNDLCRAIFDRMLQGGFPKDELFTIDLALRMFIDSRLNLDEAELAAHLADVRAQKERVFNQVAHIDRSVFSSSMKFAALLREYGVEVPMKPSPANPAEIIPALARGDREFKELLDDDTQPIEVQALLAARISAKSTIEETRTEKTLATARTVWPDGSVGLLPVPLRYYGAHTGRFSGDDGYNWQNIRRDSRIRKAVRARKGHVIVARDSSQIEARMVAWLAGQWDLVRAFAANTDVYAQFASRVYERPINKKDNPIERFVGKTGILGLGYGCGPEKFRHMLFIGSGGVSLKIDPEASLKIVMTYRRSYFAISNLWQRAGMLLERAIGTTPRYKQGNLYIGGGGGQDIRIGPCEMVGNDIWLPNGMPVSYFGLRQTINQQTGGRELLYGPANRAPKRIYGPKVIENISQALARIVITDIMKRVWKTSHLAPVLQVHDSLAYEVPEQHASAFNDYLEQEFAVRPSWAKELPLASEGHYGSTLAEAEGK